MSDPFGDKRDPLVRAGDRAAIEATKRNTWNEAIEAAAKAATDNGDRLEIHSERIAMAIRALAR